MHVNDSKNTPEQRIGIDEACARPCILWRLRLRCSVLGLGYLSASLHDLVLKLPPRSSWRAASSSRDLSAGTALGEPSTQLFCPCDDASPAAMPGAGCSSSQAANPREHRVKICYIVHRQSFPVARAFMICATQKQVVGHCTSRVSTLRQ